MRTETLKRARSAPTRYSTLVNNETNPILILRILNIPKQRQQRLPALSHVILPLLYIHLAFPFRQPTIGLLSTMKHRRMIAK